MKLLIIAEHDAQNMKPSTFHTLAAAENLKATMDLLIVGKELATIISQAERYQQLNRILVADHAVYQHELAENTAQLIAKIGKDYDYIIMGSTTYGKNILPRVAALLDVSMLSDVAEIIDGETFVRPIYAGNVMATVQTTEKIKVLSIRTTLFPEAQPTAGTAVPIEPINEIIENQTSRFVKQQLTQSERPELTAAKIIISGGRGLKSAENFKLLEDIADELGAAVGASRAAVDAGFAPNDYQVGQTGKVVAPELYIAVGISGAIQHIAGMKDSKIIVAINNDPEAPIFQIADYVLIGDLFKILPELKQTLNALQKVS